MLFNPLEKNINVFPYVLGGELADDFLKCGFVVVAVTGNFRRCSGLEQTFYTIEVILNVCFRCSFFFKTAFTHNYLRKWSSEHNFDVSAQVLVVDRFSPLHERGHGANF